MLDLQALRSIASTSTVRYSIIAGAAFAVALYLSGIFQPNDTQRALMERAIRASPEVRNIIGDYRDMTVKKVTHYRGSSKDHPYVKRLMRVSGSNGAVHAWITITNPDTENETVDISGIE